MSNWKNSYTLIVVVCLGTLLYAPSLFFDYTNFDDNILIQDNQEYIRNIRNVPDAFGKSVFINGADIFYRPIETVWLILNAQVGGSNLFIYHLSSMLAHSVAVFLIFILLTRLGRSTESSMFLSLIFLVHPVLTQAVAWIPGVVDILVSIFTVSAFIFFLGFIKSRKPIHLFLHMLCFAFALYTKEIAMGLIPVCLFYLYFIEKEKMASSGKISLLAGWLTIGAAWFLMRQVALEGQHERTLGSMLSSIVENLPVLIPYIGKILLPVNLSVMPVLKDTSLGYGVIAVILLAAFIFISKRKEMAWTGFGVFWFIVFLAPTLIHTSEFRIHQFYEHRMYLPMLGFLIFVSETDWIKCFSLRQRQYQAAGLIFFIFFSLVTLLHQRDFSDAQNFLDSAVKTSPSSALAHRNRGIFLQDKGMKDTSFLKAAEEEYLKALEINPQEKDLHNNLGVIYDLWGKKDSAVREYLAETRMNPANGQAFHNLGVIYADRNDNQNAEICFKKSIAISPDDETYRRLAILYNKMGRVKDFERTAMMLRKESVPQDTVQAAAAHTDHAADPMSVAKEMMQAGRMGEAENIFKNMLKQDSANSMASFYLGIVYYSGKRFGEAEQAWRSSVRHDSTYTDAFNNLAICLAQQGKNKEAEVVLRKLISANPDYTDGYFNTANFYAKIGKESEALFYISELRKKGIGRQHFIERGIVPGPELQKVFEKSESR